MCAGQRVNEGSIRDLSAKVYRQCVVLFGAEEMAVTKLDLQSSSSSTPSFKPSMVMISGNNNNNFTKSCVATFKSDLP